MSKNIIRKSYFFNKIYIIKMSNFINIKKRLLKKKMLPLTEKLYIMIRPNNTFVTIVGSVKLHQITGGNSGFLGPKRATPYSRYVVARNMSYYIFKKRIKNEIDIYFNSMITRKFFFFLKGLFIKSFETRFIIKNKMVAHGYLRGKKKRRK